MGGWDWRGDGWDLMGGWVGLEGWWVDGIGGAVGGWVSGRTDGALFISLFSFLVELSLLLLQQMSAQKLSLVTTNW